MAAHATWNRAKWALAATVLAALAVVGCGTGTSGGVRTMNFHGSFVPLALQVLDGEVWLVGSTPQGCGAERVDPSNLHTKLFQLPSCDIYVAAGDHHLYVLGIDESAGSPAAQEHVVSFDPATGDAAVSPVVAAQTVGSGAGHMAFAFGLGDLWLYTWEQATLSRISTATGSVQSSVKGLESGGGHPVMAFTDRAVWFAEGPGGSRLYELPAGATKPKVVYTAPDPGSVLWVSVVGNQVWAAVATYSNGGKSVHTRLVSFSDTGKKTFTTGELTVGDSASAGPDGALWSVGPGPSCNNPQKLWRTEANGKTKAVETLNRPTQGCLLESAQIASVGPYLFVLDGTGTSSPGGVLYRVSVP